MLQPSDIVYLEAAITGQPVDIGMGTLGDQGTGFAHAAGKSFTSLRCAKQSPYKPISHRAAAHTLRPGQEIRVPRGARPEVPEKNVYRPAVTNDFAVHLSILCQAPLGKQAPATTLIPTGGQV